MSNFRQTSWTLAPVASQTADMALMEDILWAKNALAASFDSSELQTFVLENLLCISLVKNNNASYLYYIVGINPVGINFS